MEMGLKSITFEKEMALIGLGELKELRSANEYNYVLNTVSGNLIGQLRNLLARYKSKDIGSVERSLLEDVLMEYDRQRDLEIKKHPDLFGVRT